MIREDVAFAHASLIACFLWSFCANRSLIGHSGACLYLSHRPSRLRHAFALSVPTNGGYLGLTQKHPTRICHGLRHG